jgi:hypothetical protein
MLMLLMASEVESERIKMMSGEASAIAVYPLVLYDRGILAIEFPSSSY